MKYLKRLPYILYALAGIFIAGHFLRPAFMQPPTDIPLLGTLREYEQYIGIFCALAGIIFKLSFSRMSNLVPSLESDEEQKPQQTTTVSILSNNKFTFKFGPLFVLNLNINQPERPRRNSRK